MLAALILLYIDLIVLQYCYGYCHGIYLHIEENWTLISVPYQYFSVLFDLHNKETSIFRTLISVPYQYFSVLFDLHNKETSIFRTLISVPY